MIFDPKAIAADKIPAYVKSRTTVELAAASTAISAINARTAAEASATAPIVSTSGRKTTAPAARTASPAPIAIWLPVPSPPR